MLKHPLARWSRAALISAAATVTLLVSPISASAEPRTIHEPARSVADGIENPAAIEIGGSSAELLAACPIDGDATFEDSWGWKRSGGRSHEGVDMVADRGTPVVAVRDGVAVFKQSRLGGNAVWLIAPNGDEFYYAHLDSFAGDSRTVTAGELIGAVGSTGNAKGPHLHFETLPGGGVENPFPHTFAACVPTPEELAAIAVHQGDALDDPPIWQRFFPRPA